MTPSRLHVQSPPSAESGASPLPRPLGRWALERWAPHHELPEGLGPQQVGLALLGLHPADLARQQADLMGQLITQFCAEMAQDHGPLVDAALLTPHPQSALAHALCRRFTQAKLNQALGVGTPLPERPPELRSGVLHHLVDASATLMAAGLLAVWTRPDERGAWPGTEAEALERDATLEGGCPLCRANAVVAADRAPLSPRGPVPPDEASGTRVHLRSVWAHHLRPEALWTREVPLWSLCRCAACHHVGLAPGFVRPARLA